MKNDGPEVKGAALRGLLRDAKDAPGGIEGLMAKIPEEKRQQFFGANIYHSFWYPYEALAVLLDAYRDMPGNSSSAAARALGKRMSDRDMTTLLKVYALVSSPVRLAAVPVKIWEQRFRNAGTSHFDSGEHNFRFTISGFRDMHPMLCEILTGYGQAVGRRKTKNFKNVHDRCIHRGARDCSWIATW